MNTPALSVVIPCYNERDSIEAIVRKVLAAPVADMEIIVVDDFSRDGTRAVLEETIRPLVSKILYHEENRGKGAALRTGFQAAAGRVVLIQDADLEYDPAEYPALVGPILRGEADVVYGSRFLGGTRYARAYKMNVLANRLLTALSCLFTYLRITDMETCYKAFRREVIQSVRLVEDRFGFEPEVTAKIAHARIDGRKARVLEVPISYHPRSFEEGKKIGWRDGLRAVYCILKYH